MAGTSNDILITIGTQLDDKGLKSLNAELAKTGAIASKAGDTGALSINKLGDSAKKSSMGFVELAAKVTAAYMAVKSMIDAYVGDAKATAKMTLALKNNTTELTRQWKSVSDLTKEFKDFASAQQEATGIGDEVTLSLMGTLTTLGVMPNDLKRVTAALQDMEAATGMSADSMARAWARLQEAPEEALGALTRVGVKIRKEQLAGMDAEQQRIFVLEKLEKAFGGQAKAMADSTEGIAQAEAAFGDFQEVLGKVIVSIIGPLAKGLSTILTAFNTIPGPVQGAIVAVGGLTTAFFALSGAINLTPIGWILTATAALGGLAMMATSGVDPLKERIDALNTSLSKLNANMTEMENKDLVQSQQLKNLSMLQRGTSAYEAEVRRLIKSNGELANSGITVKSSYADIIDALKKLDAASATVKRNRLKDISKEAMGTYWSTMSKLTLGPGNVPLPDEANAALATTANNSLIAAARALSMLGKFRFHEDAVPGAQIHLTGPNAQLSEVQAIADFRRALQEMANEGAPAGMQMPLMLNDQQIRDAYNAARALRDTSREAIADINDLNGASTISQIKVDTIDLWKMNIDLIQDEYEKRRELNLKSYMDEEKRIKELNIYEGDKAEALHLNELKFAQEDEKIRKDQIEAEKQASEATAKSAGEAINEAMSIGTAVIKKDWAGAFGQFADSIVPGVGGAFVSVVNTFGKLFATQTESTTAYFGRRFEEAMLAATRSEKIVSAIGNLVGENTANAARISAESALATITKLQNMLNNKSKYGSTGAKSRVNFFELDPETVLTALSEIQNRISAGEILNPFRELSRLTGIEVNAVGVSWKTLVETITEGLELVKDYQLANAEEGLAVYRQELQRIQDQLDTGRMSEEDARTAMIDQYDQAIAALQGVEGAEALILELEKERYRLQKGITEETSKQLLNQKQQQLLSQIDALERDIETGRASKKDPSTILKLQGLYTQLLYSMKGSGLFGSDVYIGIEDRLTNLVKDTIGATGFAVQSGTGANALIPTVNRIINQPPVVQVDGRNTNTSQTIINAPLNLPPELTTWLLRAVNAQSGRGF